MTAIANKPTGLMKHLLPFDANKDGIVTRRESADFIKDLGMTRLSAEVAATVINGAFAKPTTGKFLPFNVAIDNIAKAKHPGDSKVYDATGEIDPAKFSALWSTYDPDNKGYLTKPELLAMVKANNKTEEGGARIQGTVASGLEFVLLLELNSDVNVKGEQVLTKAALHAFYDGTLFGDIASNRRALLDAAQSGQAPARSSNASVAAIAFAQQLAVPLDQSASDRALMRTKHIAPVISAAVMNLFG